ncbi:MAG: ubiquitin-like domain-containing protein [Chloroflexota bacterium]
MRLHRLTLALLLFLTACGTSAPAPIRIHILDGGQLRILPAAPGTPADWFIQAGMIFGPNDRALLNGTPVPMNDPVPMAGPVTLQLVRAQTLTLVTPEGTRALQSSAPTVGEALHEAGIAIRASDFLDPPATTPITGALTVTYTPAREYIVSVGGQTLRIHSSARTVGAALAEAGIPLLGLDYSLPSENEALPVDGQIRVVRVSESVVLAQKSIPYETEFIASADVLLDQQQVLEPGLAGLSVSRVRIRYEDGQEVARQAEAETLVRPPQKQITGFGTKVEIKTAIVDGVQIEYWRAVQMYATAYSPCRSGTSQCYPFTASGKPVKHGVVAVISSWYAAMRGQPVYIPGYGRATIEDLGGGIPGRHWIDLGYTDSEYQSWGTWVTVYFLTPVPSSIVYVLD